MTNLKIGDRVEILETHTFEDRTLTGRTGIVSFIETNACTVYFNDTPYRRKLTHYYLLNDNVLKLYSPSRWQRLLDKIDFFLRS